MAKMNQIQMKILRMEYGSTRRNSNYDSPVMITNWVMIALAILKGRTCE